MTQLRHLLSIFSMASIDPEIMESQISAFTKQLPLLYLILGANVVVLAYTHYGIAPNVLTIVIPALLLVVCMFRVGVWLHTRGLTIPRDNARNRLRSTYILTGILGAFFAAWALCMYPYGDALAKSHVAFFMSITVIGCIFCLMHLRQAALLLTIVVAVPFTIRFTTTGEPILTAIALNFCLVLVIMVFILMNYYRDFTNLVHSQRHLAALSDQNFKMANLDSLTGLPNRRSFFNDLERMIAEKAAAGPSFALGLIDLDGFKPVNDVYGHGAGDRVLIEVGRRLQSVLGPSSLVSRLGGDEFAFILPFDGEPDFILNRSREACQALEVSIPLTNGTARVAASIGIALHGAGSTQAQLIERADYALYYAKAKQRGTAVIFSAQHENAIRVQSLIEQELRRADFKTEMTMKFQPIVDAGLGRTIAYEALARWRSPLLGNVSPIDFVAAAERTGLINHLTEVLFAKALAAAKTWPDTIGLSFNLSVRDIAAPDLIARVRDMIDRSGIKATRIAFEITETALMHDFAQARETLLGLKDLGVKIALDDFGTGYSSLHYVHRLPLDKIKIDRSFITEVVADKVSRDIVKSIVDLCRNLGIVCVVEGVETAEQAMIMRALGCNTMQGYFFGQPTDNSALDHQACALSLPRESVLSKVRKVALA